MASTTAAAKPMKTNKTTAVSAATSTMVDDQATIDPMQTLLDKVKADYQSYYTYIRPYRRKWDNYWKLWNNKRVNKQYHGDSDSFDPMTFQMIETGTDNVYGGRPKLTFLPTHPQQTEDTHILNGLWDYSWDKANMDEKVVPWGREIKITGNGCLFPTWEDGHMQVTHIPMRDCILDTTASKRENMRFAGYRRLDMIENLKTAKRFDPMAGKKDDNGDIPGGWVPRYDLAALANVKTWGQAAGDDALDKQLKDMYLGSTLASDIRKGQVEIILMNYKDKTVEVANRQKIIAVFDNPYHSDARTVTAQQINEAGDKMYDETSVPEGAAAMSPNQLESQLLPATETITISGIEPFIPVVFQRRYVDPALLIAKGDVEPIAAGQEDLNDSINTKRDNTVYGVQNIGVIDSQAKDAISDFAQAHPGSIIPIKGLKEGGANTFRWLEKPDFTAAADTEINRTKQSIRETSRIDLTNQGIVDNKNRTATEVDAQTAGATSGFTSESKNLESGGYKQLGEFFIKFTQIFLTEKQLVRIIGKEGVEFKQFDPEKYWGEYDVKVVLESTAKAKQKEDGQRVLDAYEAFKGDPDFNQLELKKMVAAKAFDMDDDDIKLLMNPGVSDGAPDGSQAPAQPLGPDGKPIPLAPSSPTAITTPGGQVHESADLAKIYLGSVDRPDVQEKILKLMGIIDDSSELAAPTSLHTAAQDVVHKDVNLAMALDKHNKDMAEPPKEVAGATSGTK